ncbi:MAG: thioredoxin family protein [Verrucomicrobiota bacterium]
MKKWLVVLAAVAVGAGAFASEGWETDFEKASAKAKAENKHILMDFSGSDWCGWCVKLDKEVFSRKAFREYAKENLILVLVDFPRAKSTQSAELKKQNEELKQKFGVRGFPTVYILSPEGKPVAKTGYQAGGPEAYIEHIKKLIADAKK